MLQFIEAFVGKSHEFAFLLAILRINGNAEIERHPHADFQGLNFGFILRADAAAERDGLLGIRLRQQQRKLVAPDAKRKIGSAQGLAQRAGGELDNLVALQVPVAVVYFFQLVQIEDDDREAVAVAFGAIQFLYRNIRRRGGDCRGR